MFQRLSEGNFFGQTIESRSVAGLVFRESLYSPNLTLPKHTHERAYFCFVLRGSYDEMRGVRTQTCKPSSLIFHHQQETHADRFHARGAHLLNIELGPKWIESLCQQSIVLDSPLIFNGGLSSYLANRIYLEFRNNDAASVIAIEGLALELIAEASRNGIHERTLPRRIKLAREYLVAHFSEPISLSSLARLVAAHPVYLAREFRKCYGCTVGEYLRQLRIELACRQLATSEDTIASIALNAGFSDQAHFSKIFKRRTGKTPSEFRDTLRRC